MPVNKDALVRYRIIDEMLRNKQHKFPSKQDILDRIERTIGVTIGDRTLEEDLRNMRENEELQYMAPISYDKVNKGYYYKDELYAITKIPITEADIRGLKDAANIFTKFKGIPYLAELQQPIQQLERILSVGKTTGNWTDETIVQLEVPDQWPDKVLFAQLIQMIREKNIIEIAYKKFGTTEAFSACVHPYLLKEYKNRWYLVALNEKYNAIRIYGLDRINSIELIKRYYEETFDSENYFKYSLGITVINKERPLNIELLFAPDDAHYILSGRIHPTQRIISNNKKGLKIELTLHPSYELTMLIRSYGSGVKVLKPKWLREEILADARKVVG